MGRSHRLAGASLWLAAAPAFGVHGWHWLAGAAIAGACAHGRLSPDMDVYPLLGKVIPGGHRGVTHFWLWPLLLAAAAALVPYGWVVAAVAVAWGSHVATDGVFGRVPVWPRRGISRWRYAGVGLRTGGLLERAVAVPAFLALAAWVLLLGQV